MAEIELLMIRDHRLYVWVEAPFSVNTDFRLSVSHKMEVIADCAIGETMYHVAATESLSDSILETVRSSESLSFKIYLDTTRIADMSLRVGVPAIFRNEFTFASSDDSVRTSVALAKFQYYQKLSEAEIDLAIGKIDALVVPTTEIPDNAACLYHVVPTGNYVEWFIISNLPDNDLYTCALNYCLKNEFVVEGQLSTLLIDSSQIASGFPRNREKARALFDRVRSSLPSRRCHFESMQLPGMVNRLERELSTGGGRLTFGAGYGGAEIRLLHMAQPDAVSPDEMRQFARSAFFSACVHQGWIASQQIPAICVESDTISTSCEQELSNWLARECRFIPLGRIELVALMRNDVHSFANGDDRFSITDYYRVKQP